MLKFSAPLQFIGDSDGLFSYQLLLTEFGGSYSYFQVNRPRGRSAKPYASTIRVVQIHENCCKSTIATATSVPEPNFALGALTFATLQHFQQL
ncbi:hypothetical protein [Nostoc sp.]|uniref:hypothetical protein n=1 Tax=Nostoc sp. TaxID=1180 RepID=UPI002FFCB8D7